MSVMLKGHSHSYGPPILVQFTISSSAASAEASSLFEFDSCIVGVLSLLEGG